MTERGTKGLELWCRRMTEGYPGVEVNNMTTSWRNGLAFCAIIHHFRPDLIDFSKLSKDDIYYNNDLAFQVAERHLGIPALLEPEDMVEFPVPDRLSILTYLSQFYQAFVVGQGSPGRIVPKRPANASDRGVVSPTSTSPPSKMPKPSGGRSRREPCAKCGLPVFIAERLNVGKHLYHRTCFRCARCNSQLSLANYYETETENQFCCETCPDEELKDEKPAEEKLVINRALSDEEKTASLKHDGDDYSSMFETALENSVDAGLQKNHTLSGEQSAEFTRARSRFITSLVDSDEDTSEDELPDLPQTDPPKLPKTEPPDLDPANEVVFAETVSPEHSEDAQVKKDLSENVSSIASSESCDSGFPSIPQSLDSLVHSSAKVSEASDRNQPETANSQLDIRKVVTKENKFPSDDGASLVKSRMRLFENKLAGDQSSEDRFGVKHEKAEKKFIHKVPSKEEQSSTGLDVKELDLAKVDSASSKDNSVDDTQNITNHIQQKSGEESMAIENADESIITISDSSSLPQGSDNPTNTSSCFPISDSNKNESILTEDCIIISDSSKDESKPTEEYPDDLNPFGDDEEEPIQKPNISLNPFDEEEDEEERKPSPKPAVRRKIKARESDLKIFGKNEGTPDHLAQMQMERISYNPFEDDEEEEKEPIESAPVKKLIPAPRISLNPFWSDGEEPENEEDASKQRPVPLPRNSRGSIGTPEPKPRKSGLSSSGLSSTTFGSTTSLSSAHSSLPPTTRKKKQAPKPPSADKQDSAHSSVTSSPSPSVQHSPKLTPKIRKAKKAPLPPSIMSTPYTLGEGDKAQPSLTFEVSPIINDEKLAERRNSGEWEQEKIIKDEKNRNRQSQTSTSPISSAEDSSSLLAPNKSMYGKWKRKKGPAPSRPIPQRRSIKPLPVVELRRELDFLEIQQQGLEKQGVRLEQIIREKCEGPDVDPDASLPIEVEDLILQLFELVNEKNELFRKQAELMYLRRDQRLAEEYADLEYQIRCLMLQPEANKTDSDKAREEELINRLVEVVARRNEIVECLEMDRVREAEEDDSINNQMNLYAHKRDDAEVKSSPQESKQKKKGKKEKLKFKSHKKLDVDKDIDESESSGTSVNKEKKKKKFNIF